MYIYKLCMNIYGYVRTYVHLLRASTDYVHADIMRTKRLSVAERQLMILPTIIKTNVNHLENDAKTNADPGKLGKVGPCAVIPFGPRRAQCEGRVYLAHARCSTRFLHGLNDVVLFALHPFL